MIVLAGTPIGNLADASERLKETLATADMIAAEDTRRTRQLMQLLNISTRADIVPLHDHNEHSKAAELVERARDETVVLVSDAGMPTVSDPGFRVVAAAQNSGVPVSVVPGPSAVLSALAVSGLATDRFSFEGFVPRKAGDRDALLRELAQEKRTMVFFESPQRLASSLHDFAQVFGGDREAAVCRELTKMYEEVKRGSIEELAAWASEGVRGEIVIVVAGYRGSPWTIERGDEEVAVLVSDGVRLKAATRQVAEVSGLQARELYNRAVARRAEEDVDDSSE